MNRKIVVYVAAPFRGANHWEIAQNIRRAELVGMRIARAGFMPLIPHANTAHFHGTLDDQFWLEGTMELMARCDVVYFDVGWEESAGCRAEFDLAKKLGIPFVRYDVDDLIKLTTGPNPIVKPPDLQ